MSADSRDSKDLFAVGDEFPMIVMGVPIDEASIIRAKSIGMNYLFSYTSGRVNKDGMEQTRKLLDLADKHGMKVMVGLKIRYRLKEGERGMANLRKLVNEYKDHPATGFWYMEDEPDLLGLSPADFKEPRRIVKELAPNIPQCILTSTVSPEWGAYHDVLDIYSYDTYPIRTAEFPHADLSEVVDFNYWAVAKGKPVIPTLQIFNRAFLDASIAKKDKQLDQPGVSEWIQKRRFPTLEEMRYWQFATLAQGARAMMFWSLIWSQHTKFEHTSLAEKSPFGDASDEWAKGALTDPSWVDTTLKESVQEFNKFTNLVRPAWKHKSLEGGASRNLIMGVWERENEKYIVLVNHWPDRRRVVTLSPEMIAEFQGGKITPWGFTRNVKPEKYRYGIWELAELKPWEVLVWKIEKE